MNENVLRANNVRETIIDDNCGISKFYAIATTLCDELDVAFLNQVDDGESINWEFRYKKSYLTLHFDVYGGVSIIQNEQKGSHYEIAKELSDWLHSRAY
jgi:hypothetical protein